jgi:hypothetical protein
MVQKNAMQSYTQIFFHVVIYEKTYHVKEANEGGDLKQ